MRRETRTRIADPLDAMRAAFDVFLSIAREPDSFPEEYNGATFKPAERVEQQFDGRTNAVAYVSFEVTLPHSEGEAALPEMERVLIEA